MSTFQPVLRTAEIAWIVSRTMPPTTIRSQLASCSRAAAALKSVSVGLCNVAATTVIPIALSWSFTPSVMSRPKSVSCDIEQTALLWCCSTNNFTPARIWS